jgi:hypothetical protein
VNAPLLGAMLAALAASAGAQQPPPSPHRAATPGNPLAETHRPASPAQKLKPASAIYTRSDRRVTSAPKLLTQVQVCNAQLGSGYFPEDEENVAAYLNETYYKFKP